MTYKTGTWGEQAQERSKNRIRTLREKVIAKLGGQCVVCGFSDIRALQIDHVLGGGAKDIHKQSYYIYLDLVLTDKTNKFQLLCANCNWIKRYQNKER